MERIDIERPLDAQCDDIVARYHAPLRRRVPQIRAALSALAAGHRNVAIETMHRVFDELAERIESHMAKEEHLLFPAICALADSGRDPRSRTRSPFVTILHPVRMLEAEHASIESKLDELRALATEVTGVETRTAEWQSCIADLAEFQAVLLEHHRAENEVLFPQALETERRRL